MNCIYLQASFWFPLNKLKCRLISAMCVCLICILLKSSNFSKIRYYFYLLHQAWKKKCLYMSSIATYFLIVGEDKGGYLKLKMLSE